MGATTSSSKSSHQNPESDRWAISKKLDKVLESRSDRLALVVQSTDASACDSILRTADTYGVQNVWMVESGTQPVAYVGEAGHLALSLDMEHFQSPKDVLTALRRERRTVWVLDDDPSGVPLDRPGLAIPPRVAIIVGRGSFHSTLLKAADCRVHLPRHGFTTALPLQVTCALVLQQFFFMCPHARGDLTEVRRAMLRQRWTSQLRTQDFSGTQVVEHYFDAEEHFQGEEPWKRHHSLLDWDDPNAVGYSNAHTVKSMHYSSDFAPRSEKSAWVEIFEYPLSGLTTIGSYINPFASPPPPASLSELGPRRQSRRASSRKSLFGLSLSRQNSLDLQTAKENQYPKKQTEQPSGKKHVAGSTMPGPFNTEAESAHLDKRKDHWCSQSAGSTYRVRSHEYIKTGIKVPCGPVQSTLLMCDTFLHDAKVDPIVPRIQLPRLPPGYKGAPPGMPSMLVVNLMLPQYQPSMWGGATDGQGITHVWYCRLDWDLVEPNAKGLLERFITDGKEKDGSPTRDRLKIILRLGNVDEAYENGGVQMHEKRLLDRWNAKPVMSTPQQRFYHGDYADGRYFEVALDVHGWKYPTRKMLQTAPDKLHLVVWDFALVVQGNSSDQLPEQILHSARMHYVKLEKVPPIPPPI